MNKVDAEQIALRFFEQHHDVDNINVEGLENGMWLVEGKIFSSSGKSIKKLRIDDKSGKIVAVE